jgi:hypothetical protein
MNGSAMLLVAFFKNITTSDVFFYFSVIFPSKNLSASVEMIFFSLTLPSNITMTPL